MQSEHFQIRDSFSSIGQKSLEYLDKCQNPFLSPSFFNALELSGCTSKTNGWAPQHIEIFGNGRGWILPGYRKYHSYGEYIFDWSLAESLRNAGIGYYPKWVMQLPFTPIELSEELIPQGSLERSLDIICQHTQNDYFTSQLLYIPENWVAACQARDGVIRYNLLYYWHNSGYRDFSDIISSYNRKRAKAIRQERSKILKSGTFIQRYSGDEISSEIIQRFYPFYRDTYLKRSGHYGYLNQQFFELWLNNNKHNTTIVLAMLDDEDIAASLFLNDANTLYGRYWGCYNEQSMLHFECCYYQGMEICIEKGLKRFHPGVQGEHKATRGFVAELSPSSYFYSNSQMSQMLKPYFVEELKHLKAHKEYLIQRLPFKRPTV